ncbi:3646_t:CDS:1 [Ambispora leptoticha]|uniref:3646_t:CDS:1 n=1 Tax=Ambispora leptoticha TaxID=144679 RepID=A0A9N8VEX5_9GLOM|nr:3646_t:CDS:1 [Ambispora leptoticha]
MENETWEEICEWEVEDDLDLASRLTIRSINLNTDNDNNIDMLNPGLSSSSSSSEESEDEIYEFVETYQRPTYANILKGFPVMTNNKNLSTPKLATSSSCKTETNNNQLTTTTSRTVNYPTTEFSLSNESIYDKEKEKYRIQRRREQKEIAKTRDQRLAKLKVCQACRKARKKRKDKTDKRVDIIN